MPRLPLLAIDASPNLAASRAGTPLRSGLTPVVCAILCRALGAVAVAAEPAKVDFARQIQPILEQHCLKCHSRGKNRGGLALENRQTLLAGGESGPAAVAGKPSESLIVELISSDDPDRRMPAGAAQLKAEQIALVRSWVEQGLPWPTEIDFGFRRGAAGSASTRLPAARHPRPTRSTASYSPTSPASVSRRPVRSGPGVRPPGLS